MLMLLQLVLYYSIFSSLVTSKDGTLRLVDLWSIFQRLSEIRIIAGAIGRIHP
jgi:hypothetical protein